MKRSSSFGCRRLILSVWLLIVGCFGFLQAFAADNPGQLLLEPPRGEIPRSFWERFGLVCVVAVVFIGFVALMIWLVRRSRTPRAEPIEITTRRELESLAQQSADSKTLSRVSRVLRAYLVTTLGLPAEETTTGEFCCALAQSESLGPELAQTLCGYFRQLDEMKFAPETVASNGSAQRALELVDAVERRRAMLQEAATQKPPVYS